jgi:hypothetical protein
MNSNTLEFISPTPHLKSFVVLNRIVEIVVADIKSIPEYQKLQRNMDLVLRICEIIENLVYENGIKGQSKGFKKDLAIKVFDKLGWNTPEHHDFLENAIMFLWSSGRIEKVKLMRRIWGWVCRLFQKKVMSP